MMRRRGITKLGAHYASLATALSVLLSHPGAAQTPASTPPAATAKASAPIDLNGYWVAVITEDWRERMVTPAKGDYLNIPITARAQKVADAWDPTRDEATGEQCRSYGAPALMGTPTRLHITWQDDNTLKVEADYGTQTRLFRFGPAKPGGGPATWQGDSSAAWEAQGSTRGAKDGDKPAFGNLKVSTSHLRPGYLRKNGIPFSANTTMTEYWDVYRDRTGVQRIMITQRVEDSENLSRPWLTALQFKKEADGSKWDPSPCSAKW
jgi:hypothetical protein